MTDDEWHDIIDSKERELWRWLSERRAHPLPRLPTQPRRRDPVATLSWLDDRTDDAPVKRAWAVGDALKRDTQGWALTGPYALYVKLQWDGRWLVGTMQLYEHRDDDVVAWWGGVVGNK